MNEPAGSARGDGWPQAILFDLDGTLIDSAPDIAAAANRLLEEEGHAPLEVVRVRSMIGNGVKKLVERSFAARGEMLTGDTLEAMTGRMMEIYGDHLTVLTAEMPAARETVRAYATAGVKIAVVTNKPEGFSRTILEAMAFAPFVSCVVGGDTGPERKPAPDMLEHACKEIGIAVTCSLMVGDSPADIGAAKNAGMASVAVRGGYTDIPVEQLGADAVADSLADLADAIERLRKSI